MSEDTYYTADPNDFGLIRADVFSNTTGRTKLDPTSFLSGARVLVLLDAGQSNIAGTINTLYTPVNASKIANLSTLDGALYLAQEPLLSDTYISVGGNVTLRVADQLISRGYCDKVVLLPGAVSGSASSDWIPGGTLYARILAYSIRLSALRLSASFVLWAQGNTDSGLGISRDVYLANSRAIFSRFRAVGITCPILVARESKIGPGFATQEAVISAAQLELVNNVDVFPGANGDALGAGYRHDNLHYNNEGANLLTNSLLAGWVHKIIDVMRLSQARIVL